MELAYLGEKFGLHGFQLSILGLQQVSWEIGGGGRSIYKRGVVVLAKGGLDYFR